MKERPDRQHKRFVKQDGARFNYNQRTMRRIGFPAFVVFLLLGTAFLVWPGRTAFQPARQLLAEDHSPALQQSGNVVNSGNLNTLASEIRPAGPALDWAARAAELKEQIAGDPGSGEAYFQLGLIYSALEPDLALAYLQQAAAFAPEAAATSRRMQEVIMTARLRDEPAYTFLETGRALASLGEWPLAYEAFRQAALARPDYAEAWAFLGEAHQQLVLENSLPDQPGRALELLQKALQLDPRSVSANTLTGLYWKRQKRLDAAATYLTIAAEIDPRNPALQTELGSCMAEMGDIPGAQAFYVRAIELAPKDPTYWRILAEFTLVYGQVREVGLPAARQAVILAPEDPRALLALGSIYYALEDLASAEKFLIRALAQDGNFAPAHLKLAMTYLHQGKSIPARQHLDQVIQLANGTELAEKARYLTQQYFP